MKVLDVAPFRDGLQRNIAMLNRLGTEMKSIEQSIEGLVALEDSLKGEGGNAIRSFYEECHLPFLQFRSTFQSRFISILERMDDALDALEPDPSGFIRESFLEGEIERGLTEIAQITESLTDEANSIMDQVADIVGLPHLDDSDVQEGVHRAKIKRDDTVTALHEFDANQTTALTPIETDIATMDSWLSNIESLFTNGVTDIDFAMDRWATLTEKNSLKTDLAHRIQEDNIQSTTEDAQLKELYELIENDPTLGGKQPGVDPLVDPTTGDYIMGHAAIEGISQSTWGNRGSQDLHPIEKTIAGIANYLVLDDLKTLTNPLSESSVPEKLWAGFSLLPAGRLLGFGVDGVKFVRRSVSGKIVNPIKISPERIVQITKAAVKVKHSVTALNKTVKVTKKFTKKVTVKLATNTLNNIAKIEKKLTGKVKGSSKAGREIIELELEDFTKEILKTKPMNSRVPDKWYKKGGSISIDEKGDWTYTNKTGKSVSYPNGFPDFTPYKHPNVEPVKIKVQSPKNNPKDFENANLEAKLTKDTDPPIHDIKRPPQGYSWHHHQDGKTMILVEKDIHDEFKHIGGQSKVNGKNSR